MQRLKLTPLFLSSVLFTIVLVADTKKVDETQMKVTTNNNLKEDFNNKKPNRIMVRLNTGITPNTIYPKLLNLNSLNDSNIKLIKSFLLTTKQKEKKYILVLESKKISNTKLLTIIKKIKGVETAEVSSNININTSNSNSENSHLITNSIIYDLRDNIHNRPMSIPKVDSNVKSITDHENNNTPETWEQTNKNSSYTPKIIMEGIIINGNSNIKIIPSNNNIDLPIK